MKAFTFSSGAEIGTSHPVEMIKPFGVFFSSFIVSRIILSISEGDEYSMSLGLIFPISRMLLPIASLVHLGSFLSKLKRSV